jgi:chemotaxis protein CheX
MSATAPDAETLHVIVGDVFTGLLGEVEPPIPTYLDAADVLAPELAVQASVSISGGWNGRVMVACSTALARQVTARLLLITDAELADEDIRDAVSELANVIGGNVKSVMPGPSVLSLPVSSLSADTELSGRHEQGDEAETGDGDGTSVHLAWREQPIQISVWPIGPDVGPRAEADSVSDRKDLG